MKIPILSGRKRRPGIMCTLGRTTDDPGVLGEMHEHGLGMARINTKHAGIAEYARRIDMLRSVADIPVMLDLNGPQIRLVSSERFAIETGDTFQVGLTSGDLRFNQNIISELEPGEFVFLGNGTIRTKVNRKGAGFVELQVLEPGGKRIVPNMGVNVPGKVFTGLDVLTPKDLEVIKFGLEKGVANYGLSFVRTFRDVLVLHHVISGSKEREMEHVITIKIEDRIGFENLRDILRNCSKSGISVMVMVARGDIFIEMPPSEMPFVQKSIIAMCRKFRVPSIVATGLLLSMQDSMLPTRAEVSDVANAITDGADWIMLSDETSNSRYPAEAVMMVSEVINAWERS